MEDIIELLNKAKEEAMSKKDEAVDMINAALKLCEKKAAVIEAMMDPMPSLGDVIPSASSGGTVINAENMTVNFFVNDPPTSENDS